MANNKNPGIRHLAIAVTISKRLINISRASRSTFSCEPFDLGTNRLVFFNDGDGNLVHLIKREKPLP